jgi:hypothetical protein
VPSSKAMHKHHPATTSTMLNRRQASPSPDQNTAQPQAAMHRRATSELKLTQDSPSTNLKKNPSHTSLRRNRSHVEVSKKNKPSTLIKRTSSNSGVNELKFTKGQVHFDLGNDGQNDGHDDDWIDASNSVSPLLSRRSSVVSGEKSAAKQRVNADNSQSQYPPPKAQESETRGEAAGGREEAAQRSGRETMQHKEYLTSRLLQRTPFHGVPPEMSAENASAVPPSSRQHSPDSDISRESTSTLPGTPRTTVRTTRPGSSGKEELTSRFVTNSGQGSALGQGSFPTLAATGGMTHAGNGLGPPRLSSGNLAKGQIQSGEYQQGLGQQAQSEDANLTDEEERANGGLVANARQRRSGDYAIPRAEMSRTQQKLYLERASSSLEPTMAHPRMGMGLGGVAAAAGPLVGGSGYEARDPRLGKLLERTGLEYLVVRRYQNPVARSLARLAQLSGASKNRRIPRPEASDSGRQSKRGSEYGGGHYRHAQHLRDPDSHDGSVATPMDSQAAQMAMTPRRDFSSVRSIGPGSALETDMHEGQGLSGSSLVDGEEDAGTVALLRNLWDKTMDLSASQD